MGANGCMRVLVVDQDSALLTAITQLLGEYCAIDAVTTKADCLDLVRANDFDVIVAGERLEDGSGLELLGQMGRNRPDMLRIFAVDRERLKLLKGRLRPFGLFRTLSYPIEPRQLLAALSAAAGIEEEIDDVEETAQQEPPPTFRREPAPPPPPPPTPVEVTVRAVRHVEPAPKARREVHDFTLVDEEPPPPPAQPPRKGGRSRSAPRAPRQPTPEALAVGSRLAAASRAKAFPPPLLEPSAKKSAFLVAAGVVVVIGTMAVVLHVSNTPDTPAFSTALLSAPAPHDPPEVVKLVADTETAFQQDDYKAARSNITALQQIAPTHSRLPFFEALLAKHESATHGTGSSALGRWFSRHTSAPAKPKSVAPVSVKTSTAAAGDIARSKPDSQAPVASTFSGKTLEDSNSAPGAVAQAAPSPLTQDPQVISRFPPEYPGDAAEKGIEGAVDLSFMVSPQGDVHDVTIVHAEPSSIFNRAAMTAVRHWKYQPRKINGVAVEAHVQLRMTFKLDSRG